MFRTTSFCTAIASLALATAWPGGGCRAQEAANPPAAQASPTASPSVPPAAVAASETALPTAIPGVTEEAVAELRQQAADAEQLTEEQRAEIKAVLDNTMLRVNKAKEVAAKMEALRAEVDEAARAVESPRPAPEEPAREFSGLPLEQLRAEQLLAEKKVDAARKQVEELDAEIEYRGQQRQDIPALLAKGREQLSKIEAKLKEPMEEGTALLAEAKRLFVLSRRQYYKLEQQWLEQSSRTYEATARLWVARKDAAQKQLQLAQQRQETVGKLLAEAQRKEAERQAREARRAAVNAHPAVQKAAEKNSEYAERNKMLVGEDQALDQYLAEAQEENTKIKGRLEDLQKRTNAAKNSPVIGRLLRSERDQLPLLGNLRERLRNRPVEVSQLELDKYDWESERDRIVPVDEAVQKRIDELRNELDEPVSDEIAAELKRVYEARAKILNELIEHARDYLDTLEKVDTAEKGVVDKTEALSSFISQNVFWVPSAPTLSKEDFAYVGDFWSKSGDRLADLQQLGAGLASDARRRPGWWCLAALVGLALIAGRPRVKRALFESGEAAIKPTATRFAPTIEATLATVFLASPTPVLLGFVGWRLMAMGGDLAEATGAGVMLLAASYAVLNLVRHACRSGGLGANHFNWDPKASAAVRKAIRPIQLIAMPLLAFATGIEASGHEPSIYSLGRLSLILALLVIGVIGFRFFRPSGSLAKALAANPRLFWFERLARVLGAASVLVALGLIIASSLGLNYTAMKLTQRLMISAAIVLACLAARALLMRWLLLAYRRVAMQRAREKRQAMLDAQEKNPEDKQAVEVEPQQVSLSSINQQARNLVGAGVGLTFAAAMLMVWSDVLPALGILSDVHLWENSLKEDTWITLRELLIAVAVLGVTLFAGRNLPGLLEIALFQRLPMDAGARYAASSMTRYVIMVLGVVVGMNVLGIGWGSVQWLVAAMTVGLGFGLQEIFANFVSGLILLFERPARLGDTVTIGAITGTVTKIQIRATTIQDWDNKELIVPNKEFITGNLVNWTLSNPTLRLIVKVGVAYGSDTRLVTRLLYEVASECPEVLEDPEPFVIFDEFGASSLNFELRVHVADLKLFRQLKHDLHTRIDDVFREHGIEISFPQRDLHIRTMPRELRDLIEQPGYKQLADPSEYR